VFGVLLRNCTLERAVERAERFRLGFADNVLSLDECSLRITVSIGVAEFDVVGEDDGGRLFQRADAALYRAKQSGRDAVHVAGFG
jgi:diguanylate cyclase (GGDEF)-like protein